MVCATVEEETGVLEVGGELVGVEEVEDDELSVGLDVVGLEEVDVVSELVRVIVILHSTAG